MNGAGSEKEWPIRSTLLFTATATNSWISLTLVINPTPNGLSVISRTRLICKSNHSGSGVVLPIPSIPNPPDSDTAAANSAVALVAIGAFKIGCFTPRKSVRAVLIMKLCA